MFWNNILKYRCFIHSRNRDENPEFENHLLSIKTECQNMIHPNSHPTIMNLIKRL